MQLDPVLRDAVREYTERIPQSRLEHVARAMSDNYRQRAAAAGLPYTGEEKVAAYLATRFPATWAAACEVFTEVRERLAAPEMTSLLDLGAGAGAASLAARRGFPALSRITLVERDPDFASAATRLLPDASLKREDLGRANGFPPHDVVVASYALGEVPAPRRAALLDAAWKAAGVALVLIEPGSPAGFAVIREARDRLLAAGAHMLAPCPAEGACPMPGGDWCHFAARVERSGLHRRLKQATLGYEDEKFSYVVLAKQPCPRAEARIIRRPLHRPGLIELTVCRGTEVRLERVTRRQPDAFGAARRSDWGEVWTR